MSGYLVPFAGVGPLCSSSLRLVALLPVIVTLAYLFLIF